jgi:microcystin-dependent protein
MPRASRKIIKNTLGVVNSWGGKIKVAGEIIYYAGATPPSGFLAANGQTVSRTTYANLFAAIGTTYGAGDGSTTFQLPDLRGEFIRGLDGGRGVDTGRSLGSFQQSSEIATFIKGDTAGSPAGESIRILNNDGLGADMTGTNMDQYLSAANQTAGGVAYRQTQRIRPRNIALLPCIQF